MKLITFALLLSSACVAFAQSGGSPYAGLDLAEGNALQMQMCSLQPKKTMADYDKMFNAYIKWSKDNGVEVLALRATPMFGGANPGADLQFEWIDMLISPYSTTGDGWDKWMSTEEGRRLNAQWQETANCRVSVNPVFNMFLDRQALSGDTRIMTLNWCTRREGVTWDQLFAKHESLMAGRPDDAPMKAWSIMYPGLGIRNPLGEFMHLGVYADTKGLMAGQNNLANNEGWRQRADYNTSYADCVGDNVYSAQVLNRPE